jgi:6-phosphogluconolactonase (cycloisomerase 2 family)
MAASAVAAGSNPEAVTVDPTGEHAYVANSVSNDVSVYSVDATGALTQVSCGAVGTPGCTGTVMPTNFAAGTGPLSVIVDPSNNYAYVVNQISNDISAYAINSATGALTRINCTVPLSCSVANPANFAAGTGPQSIVIDSSGQYAYVANKTSNNVSEFTIDAIGRLKPMTASTVAAGAGSAAVVLDRSGRYAYVANGAEGTISQYIVGSGGNLTPMSTAKVATGTSPQSIAITPSGIHAYVASTGGTVSQYTIDANGSLVPMGVPTIAAGANPMSVTVDSSGRYAYVANSGNASVSQYAIGADGSLAPMTAATVGAGATPTSVVTTGTWQ